MSRACSEARRRDGSPNRGRQRAHVHLYADRARRASRADPGRNTGILIDSSRFGRETGSLVERVAMGLHNTRVGLRVINTIVDSFAELGV